MNTDKYNFDDAMFFFEKCEYEKCITIMIDLYEKGHRKEEIKNFIYDAFINPNEEEFYKSFSESNIYDSEIEYGSLSYDFIPVYEDIFYIYDKRNDSFSGYIDYKDFEPITDDSVIVSFDSFCIYGRGDIRHIFFEFNDKRYEKVYIIPEDEMSVFLSFCKLPGFMRTYIQNFVVFENKNILFKYFEDNNNVKIPHIVCEDSGEIRDFFMNCHKKRIEKKVNSAERTPFLSICIPSYNRGKMAYENINHLRKLFYDIEVEIVLSNNESFAETEYYENIKNINDSRMVYFEFKDTNENTEVAYYRNLAKVIDLAKGKWILLLSDEDFVYLDKIPEYLTFLYNNEDMGVVLACNDMLNEKSKNVNEYIKSDDVYRYIWTAVNTNYLSGLTINREGLKNVDIKRQIMDYRYNKFIFHYPHTAIAMLAVENMGLAFMNEYNLFVRTKGVDKYREEGKNGGVFSYAHLDGRIAQMIDFHKYIFSELKAKVIPDLMMISIYKIISTVTLIHVAFIAFESKMFEECGYISAISRVYVEGRNSIISLMSSALDTDLYETEKSRIQEIDDVLIKSFEINANKADFEWMNEEEKRLNDREIEIYAQYKNEGILMEKIIGNEP